MTFTEEQINNNIMSKEYSGLHEIRERGNKPYCPKCGNYLEVVANGWFYGELFYCPKEKKVFCVLLKEITKTAGDKYIAQCEKDIHLKEIRQKITQDNLAEIEKILTDKNI